MKTKDQSINLKIFQCAKSEFMDKGFADASMRRIAEKAGVTTGMLYSRFADKEEIFAELVRDGADTVIGGKGVYLSGGEQQRIAIARVMLKDAPIVVLDEATAFADPENEARVQKAFERLAKGKTVVMIAHRLTTVQNADMIYVLKDGEIAERGTHARLMEQNGLYRDMYDQYRTSVSWKVGGRA